jgi:demethylmacrocin O-methyltransferase
MKDLNEIGLKHGTDKVNGHNYAAPYMFHLSRFENKTINLLEIGVGGDDDINAGGQSLRMWKDYFPKGLIFGIDIFDKSKHNEDRIKIFKGDQTDSLFLNNVCSQIGNIDVIIDDGSHLNSHVITTFKILFPLLKDGGIYVIEDTQTSYWKSYGGSLDLKAEYTLMNFFKSLTDNLNNSEFPIAGYEKTYFDKNIISIHFYHNLIFVYKGQNTEQSNIIRQ